MSNPFFDQLWEEGKLRPFATMALTLLLLAVPYIYINSASAKEVAAIRRDLTDLGTTYKIGLLEQKLQATETELFSVQQRIVDRKTSHRYVDPLNYDRADELTIEKERIERKLTYIRTHG